MAKEITRPVFKYDDYCIVCYAELKVKSKDISEIANMRQEFKTTHESICGSRNEAHQ